MTEVTAATQAAGGLKCDPPRRALGLYNLNGTRPASAEELTSECEKRALADKGVLRTAPAGNPKLSIKALVALLRPLANAAGFIETLGVAAKRSRDWREAGESEAGPVNKEARLAPETPTLAAQPGQLSATSGCDARRLRRAWRCGRGRNSWALSAPNAHSDGRMSPAFSDAAFLFALCALLWRLGLARAGLI
jgi:hypothetical protein